MNPLNSSVLPFWDQACEALAAQEPGFQALFDRYPGQILSGSGDPFQTLANAIIGQQISVTAAQAIWDRLAARLGAVTPGACLTQTLEDLRALGLSYRKAEYLQGLARGFLEGALTPEAWPGMSDQAVEAQLVSLRGIGPWTAQMFLIFHLHRPDVLPVLDIGLQKAAAKFFGLSGKLEIPELEARAEAWRPWRTVATWYLWRTLDPIPIVY